MVKILIGTLLALTTANALAGNMYIYKDKGGQVLLTNVNTSGNFDKFAKKVKVTYYSDSNSTPKKADRGVYLEMADKDTSPSIDTKKANRGIYLEMADK